MKKIIFTLIITLYLSVNSYSQWKTNGKNVILIDSTEKVGIGTSMPTTRLNVNGGVQIDNGEIHVRSTTLTRLEMDAGTATADNWITSFDEKGNRLWVLNFADRSLSNRFGLYSQKTKSYVFNITTDGNVGINTNASLSYALQVCGSIRAKEVLVQTGWCDYVFDKNYPLRSLNDVEKYITQNKHLPDVPSAAEVETNGVQVGQMDSILIKKIEEFTLYIINQNKLIEQMQKKILRLEKMNVEKKKQEIF